MRKMDWFKREDMFKKIWWRFYRFDSDKFDITCLYVLDDVPFNLFGIYFL